MAQVYAKLLYAEKRTWSQVPDSLKREVKSILKNDVANGYTTPELYGKITGEPYVA